jgi:hypothetical protein
MMTTKDNTMNKKHMTDPMDISEVNAILQTTLNHMPGMKEFQQRIYHRIPGNHATPRQLAKCLVSMASQKSIARWINDALLNAPGDTKFDDQSADLQLSLSLDMARFHYPFWMVGDELATALVNTSPPKEWDTTMARPPLQDVCLPATTRRDEGRP